MIDILALLEEKTRGNLTAEERQLLEQILLRAASAYVEIQTARARRRRSRVAHHHPLTRLPPASRSSAAARRPACP